MGGQNKQKSIFGLLHPPLLKGNAKPGGLRLTPDGFAAVALQLASWFLF